MQSHIESSQRSFSMLGTDPFGPASHEYGGMGGDGPPSNEFGHLIPASNNSGATSNDIHHSNSKNNNNNNRTSSHHNNNNNNLGGSEGKGRKTLPPNGKKTKGRVKIKMEFIDNKLRRYTTFSKRKTGIMKKAYELSTLTGTQVMLLVASETGHVYTFATRKLQPMITSEAGKALIQTCLNSPDPPSSGADSQRMSATGYEETELTYAADTNVSTPGGEHALENKDECSDSNISSDGDDMICKDGSSVLSMSSGVGVLSSFANCLAQPGASAGSSTSSSRLKEKEMSSSVTATPLDLASCIKSSSGEMVCGASSNTSNDHHHSPRSPMGLKTSLRLTSSSSLMGNQRAVMSEMESEGIPNCAFSSLRNRGNKNLKDEV